MALFGALIKTALDLNAQFQSTPDDAKAAQVEQLRDLLETAKDTAFGIYYDFASLLEADDLISAYQARVPTFTYERMNQQWWSRQQDAPNITWPGRPGYFALSSGTTGKESKRIPVTDEMIDCFRKVGQSQIAALANFNLPNDFFEKEVLMLGSSAHLTSYKNHLEGEISGINSRNIPGWFDGFYKPGKKIASIDNWEDRVSAIAEKAPEWDIVALAGIPSWIRMMLLKIIEVHQLETIHDLWPNLRLYASGGVAFEPHRKSFAALTRKPLIIMDTYLASEGFFAFTARPGTINMRLAFEHGIFFEFIPFDERGFDGAGEMLEDPEIHHLGQVVPEQEYALVISTPAGAWRYTLGDTVKFKDLKTYEMVISGRTKYFLNVVGSQLSEEKLNAGIKHLSEELKLEITEFAVAAVQNDDGEYIHQWVLGTDGDFKVADQTQAAELLDDHLQEANKNYRVARSKALKGVQLLFVDVNQVYGWIETRKKKGGQIKVPKVMKEEKMLDLLNYLDQSAGEAME